jgi:hypothetical protein
MFEYLTSTLSKARSFLSSAATFAYANKEVLTLLAFIASCEMTKAQVTRTGPTTGASNFHIVDQGEYPPCNSLGTIISAAELGKYYQFINEKNLKAICECANAVTLLAAYDPVEFAKALWEEMSKYSTTPLKGDNYPQPTSKESLLNYLAENCHSFCNTILDTIKGRPAEEYALPPKDASCYDTSEHVVSATM